ncbi:CO4A6-like protein, partial [Mya arenaria]
MQKGKIRNKTPRKKTLTDIHILRWLVFTRPRLSKSEEGEGAKAIHFHQNLQISEKTLKGNKADGFFGKIGFFGNIGFFGGIIGFFGKIGLFGNIGFLGGIIGFLGKIGLFGNIGFLRGNIGFFGKIGLFGNIGFFGGIIGFFGKIGLFGNIGFLGGNIGFFGRIGFLGKKGFLGGMIGFLFINGFLIIGLCILSILASCLDSICILVLIAFFTANLPPMGFIPTPIPDIAPPNIIGSVDHAPA